MRWISSRALVTVIEASSESGSSSRRIAGEISGRMLSMRRSRVFIGSRALLEPRVDAAGLGATGYVMIERGVVDPAQAHGTASASWNCRPKGMQRVAIDVLPVSHQLCDTLENGPPRRS